MVAAATAATTAAAGTLRIRDLSESEREARRAALTETGKQRVDAGRQLREGAAARQEEEAAERAAAVAATMTTYEVDAQARKADMLAKAGLTSAAAALQVKLAVGRTKEGPAAA